MNYLHAAVSKHCNFYTEIDSPPSANGETPQKFLLWLAVILSLKVWDYDSIRGD